MLVLTRRNGESIRIGDGIIVTVLDQSGGQVKVGITAPPQVPIHREEIYLKIKAENLAAAQGSRATDLLLKHLTNKSTLRVAPAPRNPINDS